MKNKLSTLIVFLLVLLSAFSGYLVYQEVFPGKGFCIVNPQTGISNCSIVQASQYSTLLGIRLTYLGFAASIILLVLYLISKSKHKQKNSSYKSYLLLVMIGLILAVYFISIQAFILKIFCPNCMVFDSTMILTAILSITEFFLKK